MRAKMRRAAGAVMAAMMAFTLFTGCSKEAQEAEIQATRVETQAASRGTLEITGTYIGTVSPHNSVNVTPLVSGTVESVKVKVGDRVKAGDVLCQFDDTAADLQLQSAKNAVETAKAGKEAAEDQIDSAKKQAEASITSMKGQIKTLKEQKKSSESQLEALQDSLDSFLALYNKDKKYDLIVNKSAILFGDKKYDITQDVINGLNKRYKKEAAKPATKKEEK